ncbi:hypothetical protein [Nostoc sp. 'Peltigera membranacea cyanobiont' N6]|uniref:hypothetical protein n=1 Tax=Nostoc sp. 'Peltigera membranacea cyanobiont' N6 TaxID=1261031 RepID=UPI0021571C4D|nr:hypothetical protein [Nostoc sp. 'Peltigera membranacea cyanobiont' N6]
MAITTLQLSIQQIQASGEIAPPGCCVLRYQARGKKQAYWYYKLHATKPIFSTTQPNKLSKYKHLGKAGSLLILMLSSPWLEEPKSIT